MNFFKYAGIALVVSSIFLMVGCSGEENRSMNKTSSGEVIEVDNVSNKYINDVVVKTFITLSAGSVDLSHSEFLNKVKEFDVDGVLSIDAGEYEYLPNYCKKYTVTSKNNKSTELIVNYTEIDDSEGSKSINTITNIDLRLLDENVIISYENGGYSVSVESKKPLLVERPEHSLGGKYSNLQQALDKNKNLSLSEVEVILNHKFTEDEKIVTSLDGPGVSIENATVVEFENNDGNVEIIFNKDSICSMMYSDDTRYQYENSVYDDVESGILKGDRYSLHKAGFTSLNELFTYLKDVYSKNN